MGRYRSGCTRDCTDDYVRLDVRWCKRQGYLRRVGPACCIGHDGESASHLSASKLRTAKSLSDTEPVREATSGSTNTIRLRLNGRLAPSEEIALGSVVRRVAVVPRSCMARRCLHVGIAFNSPMNPSGNLRTSGHYIRRKGSTRN